MTQRCGSQVTRTSTFNKCVSRPVLFLIPLPASHFFQSKPRSLWMVSFAFWTFHSIPYHFVGCCQCLYLWILILISETQSFVSSHKVSPPSSVLQNWTNPEVKGQWELCDLNDGGTNESVPTGSQSSSFCNAQSCKYGSVHLAQISPAEPHHRGDVVLSSLLIGPNVPFLIDYNKLYWINIPWSHMYVWGQ